MNNHQVRSFTEVMHMVNEKTYVAFAMVIFLVCAILLNIYVSFSASAVIGVITAILVLISLVE